MAIRLLDNDIIMVTTRATIFAQDVLFTHHYQYQGPQVGDFAPVAQALNVLLMQPGGVTSSYIAATPQNLIGFANGIQIVYPFRFRKLTFPGLALAGNQQPTEFPNTSAALTVTGDTANRASLAVKKIIQPGLVVNDGELDGGYVALVNNIGDALRTTLPYGAGNLVPVIFGRRSQAVPASVVPITGFSTGTTSRVMRRRTVRVGS